MAKKAGGKRTFSIYLLRNDFDVSSAIKEESLKGSLKRVEASNLPDGAALYLNQNKQECPWWVDYWGVERKPRQAAHGAIVFLKAGGRDFALTFGTGFRHLRAEAYEYDFGLTFALNSVPREKVMSTDSLAPVNARRQRTQIPSPAGLEALGFDGDKTILRRMTGRVDAGRNFEFTTASGADSLRVGMDVMPEDLVGICERLCKVHEERTYEDTFPAVGNLKPENDVNQLDLLNTTLCERIRSRDPGLGITVPTMIDYDRYGGCIFSGAGKRKGYEDIGIEQYFDYLRECEKAVAAQDDVKLLAHKISLMEDLADPESQLSQHSIHRCLICEVELGDSLYYLSDGAWYKFKKTFVERLRAEIDPCFVDSVFPTYNHAGEGKYNLDVPNHKPEYICLDTSNMAPQGFGNVEPCDLYAVENGTAVFVHVKRGVRSATLSHLFRQGANPIEMLKLEESFKDELKRCVEDAIKASGGQGKEGYGDPVYDERYKVVYGIITHKDCDNSSRHLPIFSCVSLREVVRFLKLAGVEVKCMYIKQEGHIKVVRDKKAGDNA